MTQEIITAGLLDKNGTTLEFSVYVFRAFWDIIPCDRLYPLPDLRLCSIIILSQQLRNKTCQVKAVTKWYNHKLILFKFMGITDSRK